VFDVVMVMTSWLALQLLLDAHSLKSYLLDLPSVGAAVAKKAPSPYVRVCVCACVIGSRLVRECQRVCVHGGVQCERVSTLHEGRERGGIAKGDLYIISALPSSPSSYSKVVTKGMEKAELILKVGVVFIGNCLEKGQGVKLLMRVKGHTLS
jgi:hypothetical protein